jgi:transcriptional regulator with XRE-family HTH domain
MPVVPDVTVATVGAVTAPSSQVIAPASDPSAIELKWWERLQAKMREFGWSKAELSRRSGVAYDSVNKYLRGNVDNPRGDVLDQLSLAVGQDKRWLLFGDSIGEATVSPQLQNVQLRAASAGADKLTGAHHREQLQTFSPMNYGISDDISSLTLVGWRDLPGFVDSELSSPQLISRLSEFGENRAGRQVVLSVPDMSMAPNFKRGDLIICAMGVDPEPDDLVVAGIRRRGGISYYFRRYGLRSIKDSQEKIIVLNALNKEFPEIRSGRGERPKIFGKIIGHGSVRMHLFEQNY